MKPFLTSALNKIDAKGRVSVPARFRAVIGTDSFQGVWCFASFVGPSIEGYSAEGMDAYAAKIASLAKYSKEREAFERSVLASTYELTFDSEGRIVLPEQLTAHAGLSENAMFVGLGDHFEIWEPRAYDELLLKSRALAAASRHLIDPGAKP